MVNVENSRHFRKLQFRLLGEFGARDTVSHHLIGKQDFGDLIRIKMNDIFPGKRGRRLRNKLSIFNTELDAILDGITGPIFKGLAIYGIGEKFGNVPASNDVRAILKLFEAAGKIEI